MRWVVLTPVVLALTLLGGPGSARAAAGYDSSYFGESAFLTLQAGQTGQFAVGFNNTGSIGWQTATSAQVNLAICLADKVTCNVPSPNAAWAVSWYSSTAYATQSTTYVGPGQTGWFVYSVRVPAGASGTIRFNGDLVLNATGEKLHPEGYYQDVFVVGPTTIPTRIEVTPAYQNARIGTFPLLTATVTADPPSGSTTRPPVANVVVIFDATNTSGLNPPQSFAATTNTSGQASITYTRNNPGTDSLVVYVADAPTVRSGASVVWGLTAGSISVTPDTSATAASDAGGCRSYSFTATNPTNGAPLANTVLQVNFLENIGRTTDRDGGATIVGNTTGSPTPTLPINKTSDGAGAGTFGVCGNGADITVTPIVFDNAGGGDANLLGTGDSADAGGPVTFESRRPTLTVTPTESASRVVGDQRVYTVSAKDQFNSPFTGAVRVSFVELQDGDPTTGTTANVTWYDNDGGLATTGVTGSAAPAGTTDVADSQNLLIPALNAAGQTSFGVYAPSGGTGRPIVFVDANTDLAVQPTEAQAQGGATTWSPSTLSGCTLTKSKSLLPPSPGSANTTVLSDGDVFLVFTFRDQSGAAIDPPSPAIVTFTVSNAGPSTIAARAEGQATDTTVSPGSTASISSGVATAASSTYAVLDSAGATSATVTGSSTSAGISVSCTVNVRWVAASPEPTSGMLSGTVIDIEKGGSSDGGGYVLQTSSGTYVITYAPGQPLIVSGASATESQFEAALSNGDLILWSYNGGAESHNITTNN